LKYRDVHGPVAVIDMNLKTVLTLAIVALVLSAGAAAAQPAASPDDAPNDERDGPPAELPGPVPDFVGDILDLVNQKLAGGLSGAELGEALSGLLGGDGGSANADGQSG
jgi:hypothetical protein